MTATDELRRLLDERGVEHYDGVERTLWGKDASGYRFSADELTIGSMSVHMWCDTPEQAIAATLGVEPDEAAMVKLHDRMNAALLEYERAQGIEKRDGDGGVVVPFVAEMHSLLEEAAALSSCNCTNDCTNSERTGTCNADETETWECVCDQIGRYGKRVTIHIMECSECGHTYEHVNGGYEYCPHCRARIVEVSE
jgi:predicted Zn-ribbon and HTH transcriptional regulator